MPKLDSRPSTRRVIRVRDASVQAILSDVHQRAGRRVCCIADCDVHRIGDDCGKGKTDAPAGPGVIVYRVDADRMVGYACVCCTARVLAQEA